MTWTVVFHPAFDPEFGGLPTEVQDDLLSHATALKARGPLVGRPYIDTLNGSAYANMKELRFNSAGGVWRVAFAFGPKRSAVLLVAGDKKGENERRFYRRLIRTADQRYAAHLSAKRGGTGAKTTE